MPAISSHRRENKLPDARRTKAKRRKQFFRYTFNSIPRNGVCRVAKYFRRWKPAASGHTGRVIGEKGESSKELVRNRVARVGKCIHRQRN